MGYGMAINLRKKLDESQILYICDTNNEAIKRFQSETESLGRVEVVKDGAEAIKVAVSRSIRTSKQSPLFSHHFIDCVQRTHSSPCSPIAKLSSPFT